MNNFTNINDVAKSSLAENSKFNFKQTNCFNDTIEPCQLQIEPHDFIVFKTDKFPAENGAAIEIKITNNANSLKCYKVIQ